MEKGNQEIKVSKNFDLGAEAYVLSCILEQPSILVEVQKKLVSPNMFYSFDFKCIYDAMLHLYQNDGDIDEIMLVNALKTRKTMSPRIKKVLSELNIEVPDISTYEGKIIILIDKWKVRETERMVERVRKLAGSGICSFDDIKLIMENYAYLEESSDFKPKTALQILKNETEINKEFIKKGQTHRYRGIPTSFQSLRKYLVYRRKNTTIVAARPGHGKTSFGLREAYWQAKNGFRAAYFTLEMGEVECTTKLICMDQHIEYNAFELLPIIEQTSLTERLMAKLIANKTELLFDDFSFSLREIIANIKSLHRVKPLDIVYVDYIQLIENEGRQENRNSELSRISRVLKKYSSKLDFAGVILSQLNRDVEKRANRRPILSDLRDSGALENDTSIALALYNGELYGDEEIVPGQVELLFLKSRFGPVGKKKLYFQKKYMLFSDLTIDSSPVKVKLERHVSYMTTTSKFTPNFKIRNKEQAAAEKRKKGKFKDNEKVIQEEIL